ncbi:INO80 complex subunit C-like [Xenia sp. Carnegie-2017]|uniref:INO80 complex subunit C-like n=1 Tax=Xenia sp. Carnegie-2017 TaxID=2897299 RepID=UPI001F04C5E9|nr:INO80 complex subunit C-like [Xenia sp. Carnegie-2017]
MAASRPKRNNKRSFSPAGSAAASSFSGTKKKKIVPAVEDIDYQTNSPSSFTTADNSFYNEFGNYVFKDSNFEHSGVNSSKKRLWKNLKQIISQERALPWRQDDPTYSSIEAPPSFKPAKKYCDITGLQAKYKDPQTRMLYSTSEEFSTIRNLTMDIIGGYLNLRKAAPT